MNNKKDLNVLLIVEGEKTERIFFEKLSEMFNLDFNFYCYSDNIYNLYWEMKSYDFNCDIKTLLKDRHKTVSYDDEVFDIDFAYTYLIFDCDLHHTNDNGYPMIESNLDRLKEMSEYFVDETDPTVGKLYINYPMMESYKDADSFFDENYADNFIDISELNHYKEIVGQKMLCHKRLDTYTKDDLEKLILMNVYKLHYIFEYTWCGMNYHDFQHFSQVDRILNVQKDYIEKENKIGVLNTSLFLPVDYFGNESGFYNHLLESETSFAGVV